ncbi:hypothetical protein BDV29DRAFT_187073 [Aspergillus leporis]|uniref:BTB domain-containing protein n=1 Tax=Aspergillus leporis TaxID=41062 RepID=A0A5N5XG78_9EURO|nr:hypothetical protein BDV29DRAFT_187073 [Aspergillus leporis]
MSGNDLGLEQLDPERGCYQSTRRFLVSSKMLNNMASPVFAKLFGSNFYDCMQLADSPLSGPEQGDPSSTERLAVLAIHYDKYDYVRLFGPWAATWFIQFQPIATEEGYGYLLAAHLFRFEGRFSRISLKAQTGLSPTFFAKWEAMNILDILPDNVRSDLTDRIEKLLRQMHLILQDMVNKLKLHRRGYGMQGMVCVYCGKTHPSGVRTCHSCGNSNLYYKFCTENYRLAEYFEALKDLKLWPSLRVNLKHSCNASPCPMESKLDMLVQKATGMIG